ncbi:MAG: 3-phosphoglycerate dehydrogenase, partial [Pyrobaculum sp.]
MLALIVDNVHTIIKERLEKLNIKVDLKPGVSREELLKIVKDYDILIFRGRLKIDKEIIDTGKN